MPADFPADNSYDLERCMHRLTYPSPSPHRSGTWCRNINLLSIDYAFRPRLRYRLTLRRLTLRRKPWVYGERVFHPFYRLLMSAFALLIPPEVLADPPSQAYRTLPYHSRFRVNPQLRYTA